MAVHPRVVRPAADRHAPALDELQAFLGLATPLPQTELRYESLDKWRSQLSDRDVEAVESVVGQAPPPA